MPEIDLNRYLTGKEGTAFAQRYQVVRRIGSGTTGQVFEVLDKALNGKRLAMKVIDSTRSEEESAEQVVQRFRNEVIATRSLDHPNIVRSHDSGELPGGLLFLTMDFVDGQTLEVLIRDGYFKKRGFGGVLTVIRGIAHGLACAHEQGIIHRDLKSSNIFVNSEGHVKIGDFGLAFIRDLGINLTKTGNAVGTPVYMAPEQVLGEPLDERVDIYAMGIIVFELITGKLPYDDDNYYALANRIVNQPLPRCMSTVPRTEKWIYSLIDKATAKNRMDRFDSANEMLEFISQERRAIVRADRKTTSTANLIASARKQSRAPWPIRVGVVNPLFIWIVGVVLTCMLCIAVVVKNLFE